MKKILVEVMMFLLAASGSARGQDAMDLYDLARKSTVTYKKVDYFTRALALNPELVEAYQQRGTLLYFQEKYTEAIQDFQHLIALKQNVPEAHLMPGLSYLKAGDRDADEAPFTRAIELSPQRADAYRCRAEIYRLKGLLDDAVRDATRAIEIGGNERIVGGAYTTRSKSYRALGRTERADADFKKASKLDPELYKHTMLTSTELLASWAGESSRLKTVGRMGAVMIAALLFVIIFKLALLPPRKKDDNH